MERFAKRGAVSILQTRCGFLPESEAREDRARVEERKNPGRAEREKDISAWANGYYCLAPDWRRSPHAKNALRFTLANSFSREKKESRWIAIIVEDYLFVSLNPFASTSQPSSRKMLEKDRSNSSSRVSFARWDDLNSPLVRSFPPGNKVIPSIDSQPFDSSHF